MRWIGYTLEGRLVRIEALDVLGPCVDQLLIPADADPQTLRVTLTWADKARTQRRTPMSSGVPLVLPGGSIAVGVNVHYANSGCTDATTFTLSTGWT